MVILNGNKLSKKLLKNISEEIKQKQLKLKLAVILVENSLVSKSYINKKQQVCKMVGINFQLFNFPSDIDKNELKKEIKKIGEDKNISGMVVQLPLPKNLNSQEILNLIPEEKDIDILSESNFEKFSKNELLVLPPVVGAVKNLLEEYKISIQDKRIVLIGKGRLVGKPLSVWLQNHKADFSVVDKAVKDISPFTKNADIIISGAGSANLIKADMVKKGAVLIDAGTSSEESMIKGDIDPLAYEYASYVAPVPGGVGPMTIVCLIDNLVKLNLFLK